MLSRPAPPHAVLLPRALHTALVAAATERAPAEWAAVLGGRVAEHVAHVARFAPLATRGDDERWSADAVAFARAEAALREAGCAFVGFVHSHPGASAAPSAHDVRHGWRGCVQLVLALPAAGGATLCAFTLGADGARPLPIVVRETDEVRP